MRAVAQSKRAFTLVELLVVIAVIAILISLLMVGLQTAKRKSHEAYCMNNLKQFAVALYAYRGDFRDRVPPWLSSLYPKYNSSADLFFCLEDRANPKGSQGGKPDGVSWIGDQFPETDDNLNNPATDRNAAIKYCSYFYEFSSAKCSWGWQGYLAGDPTVDKLDFSRNGEVSWAEAKYWQLDHGDNTYLNNGKPYSPAAFPVVRCFWHASARNENAFNLAYDGHVFKSVLKWELNAQ